MICVAGLQVARNKSISEQRPIMYLVPFSKVCRVMTRRRSNILISAILAILCFATSAFALHEHQAGTFDWHHAWVGKSTWSTTLGQDTVIVGTERNVLAALDTQSGAIKWRQLLQGHATTFEQVASGILTVIDNPPKVQMWDAHSGFLQWEHPFNYRNVSATALIDSSSSALLDAIIIAANSQVVSKISAADGQSVWTTQRHEKTAGGDEIVSLHIRKQQLYVVERLQVESVIQVTVVDVETGDIVKTNKISTAPAIHNLVVTGDYIVWTEKDTVNWAEVGAKKAQSTTITTLAKSVASFAFIEPQTLEIKTVDKESDLLYMTAVTLEEEKVAVATSLFRIQPKTLALLTDLGIQEDAGAVDMLDSTLARFTSAGKELVVDFLTISPVDGSASVEEKQTIAHDSSLTGNVVFAKVINVSPLRALVVTASGSTFMYDQEKMAWSREEAMAHTTASEFLELPEKQLWTQMADELSESLEEQEHIQPLTRYLRRLQVHASEMKNLPNWLLSRLIGSTAQSNNGPQSKRDPAAVLQAQSCWMNATAPTTTIYRDNFGLRKLLISVTDTGKIIAQDSANKGQIVWSRYFKDVQFTHVFVVRSVSVKLPPIIVAMGVSGPDGYWETHLYRLNALTGEYYISTAPDADQYFEPVLITETQVAKVMRLPIEESDERTHILALYEAGSNRVYIYPDGEGARASFRKFINDFYFVRQSKNGSFKGYKVQEGYRGSLNAVPVWTLDLAAADETVVAVGERQQYEKVALIGRALGNRNVLYKYLNPHMFAIITANAERQTMTVRLVDAVKGTVFYEVVHQNVDAVNNSVHVAQAENWVVYHFWSNDPKAHGYQAVVLELFEGRDENERVASTNFSSYDNIQPNVLSGAFMFPYPVQTMGVTTTRNGVSTREIIFGLSTHQIMNVNKRLLDPRRPVTDKPSKEQVEEGLIPYGPIPDERQMFLTYNLEVLGIKHIATSPALLESTSLVFAYGLDTFFSRSSPSKRFDVLSEDFSKSQLLLTILGLVVAILISGPMVRRKQVNTLWK